MLRLEVMVILVIEGPSASGKTTWVNRHAGAHAIAEIAPPADAPRFEQHPRRTLETWQRWNEARWAAATQQERDSGVAVTDGDPLKLHYTWCLWQIGHASEDQWHYRDAGTCQPRTAVRPGAFRRSDPRGHRARKVMPIFHT